jgi:hypothetical protein
MEDNYVIEFPCKYQGKRLSWVVENDSNWLIEWAIPAYSDCPEILEVLMKAVGLSDPLKEYDRSFPVRH